MDEEIATDQFGDKEILVFSTAGFEDAPPTPQNICSVPYRTCKEKRQADGDCHAGREGKSFSGAHGCGDGEDGMNENIDG